MLDLVVIYLRNYVRVFTSKTNKTHSIRISCFNILKQPENDLQRAKANNIVQTIICPSSLVPLYFWPMPQLYQLNKAQKIYNSYQQLHSFHILFFFSSSSYFVLLVFLTSLRNRSYFLATQLKCR